MKKKILAIIMAITILVPSFAFGQTQPATEAEVDLRFLAETLEYIERNYPFETEEKQLVEGALKGMLQSLDPYSDYYTKEEAEDIYAELLGEFSGIGVYIEKRDEYIDIVNLMKGQPAEKAGIQKGDKIVSVDKVDIKDMDLAKVSKLIKGPKDTKVTLGIKRGEKLLKIEVIRREIKINPVEYRIIEENIGYIELKEFNGNALGQVKNVLKYFDSQNISKIIFDVRGNPGGQLYEAIEITKLFVPRGEIVHIREKNKALVSHVSNLEKSKYELIVLVNENSASAAEIFAGAVKDRGAGTLIGGKTFGKGLVQSLVPVKHGGIVKLTTAEYLTPNKTSIHGVGIEPDIKIENTNIDHQMEKAIEILK